MRLLRSVNQASFFDQNAAPCRTVSSSPIPPGLELSAITADPRLRCPTGWTHSCDPADCASWQYPCGGEVVGYPGQEACSAGCCWDTCLLAQDTCNASNTVAASTISTLFDVRLARTTYSIGTQVLSITVGHTIDGGATYRTLTPGSSEFPAFASGCHADISFDFEETSLSDIFYGHVTSAPDCPIVGADNTISFSRSFNSSHVGTHTASIYFQVGTNALGNCVAENHVPGLGFYGWHQHTAANIATNPCEQVTLIPYPVALTITVQPSLPPGTLLPPAPPDSPSDGLLASSPPVPYPPCSPLASTPAGTAANGRLRRLVHPNPQYCAGLPRTEPSARPGGLRGSGREDGGSDGGGGASFPVLLVLLPPLLPLLTLVALYSYHVRQRKLAEAQSPSIAPPIRLPAPGATPGFVSPRQVRWAARGIILTRTCLPTNPRAPLMIPQPKEREDPGRIRFHTLDGILDGILT